MDAENEQENLNLPLLQFSFNLLRAGTKSIQQEGPP